MGQDGVFGLRTPGPRTTANGVPDTGTIAHAGKGTGTGRVTGTRNGTERMSGIPASFPYATTSPDSRVACNLRVILENSRGGG